MPPSKDKHKLQPLGYKLDDPHVWYSQPAIVARGYLLCLLRAEDLFADGCGNIPRQKDERTYIRIMEGKFVSWVLVCFVHGSVHMRVSFMSWRICLLRVCHCTFCLSIVVLLLCFGACVRDFVGAYG